MQYRILQQMVCVKLSPPADPGRQPLVPQQQSGNALLISGRVHRYLTSRPPALRDPAP